MPNPTRTISLPKALLTTYLEALASDPPRVPPLSQAAANGLREALRGAGIEVPEEEVVENPRAAQTAKATAARWPRSATTALSESAKPEPTLSQRKGGLLTWIRVDGEIRSTCGRYVIWIQERGPRTDPCIAYGAALVDKRYARPPLPAEWLTESAPLAEAKALCESHAAKAAEEK